MSRKKPGKRRPKTWKMAPPFKGEAHPPLLRPANHKEAHGGASGQLRTSLGVHPRGQAADALRESVPELPHDDTALLILDLARRLSVQLPDHPIAERSAAFSSPAAPLALSVLAEELAEKILELGDDPPPKKRPRTLRRRQHG